MRTNVCEILEGSFLVLIRLKRVDCASALQLQNDENILIKSFSSLLTNYLGFFPILVILQLQFAIAIFKRNLNLRFCFDKNKAFHWDMKVRTVSHRQRKSHAWTVHGHASFTFFWILRRWYKDARSLPCCILEKPQISTTKNGFKRF